MLFSVPQKRKENEKFSRPLVETMCMRIGSVCGPCCVHRWRR